MKKSIRWGIVGPGNIARKFAVAVKNVDGACLSAVASRSIEKSQEFANKYDIPNVFGSYEEMAKSDCIDAVYIATPHPFHKPCSEIFLNAKKHVLCEKPLCVNADDAKALFECAKENGVFLMEAMWTRFLPAIDEALKIAKSGEIGTIRGVSADFCYSCTPEDEPKIFRNDMAGGSLLDVGIYGLNFAAIVLGNNPETVVSVADIDYDVDCHTHVILKYSNGTTASISSALTVDKPADGYIYGTKGYIKVPDFYGAKELFVNVGGVEKHISKPSIGDGFEEEIIEACTCICKGKLQSDVMPMSETLKIMELMDLIRGQIGIKYPFDK